MTTPTIPPLPQDPTWADEMRYFEAQQRERTIAASVSLAAANAEMARVQALAAAASERLTTLMEAMSAAPPSGGGEGLTMDHVGIVGGVLKAVRDNAAPAAA